jgi:hypothetical protein
VASDAALICLKAKAYLDLSDRKAKGENIDSKNVTKHRSDVFRLITIITPGTEAKLEGTIRADMEQFIARVEEEKPDYVERYLQKYQLEG